MRIPKSRLLLYGCTTCAHEDNSWSRRQVASCRPGRCRKTVGTTRTRLRNSHFRVFICRSSRHVLRVTTRQRQRQRQRQRRRRRRRTDFAIITKTYYYRLTRPSASAETSSPPPLLGVGLIPRHNASAGSRRPLADRPTPAAYRVPYTKGGRGKIKKKKKERKKDLNKQKKTCVLFYLRRWRRQK